MKRNLNILLLIFFLAGTLLYADEKPQKISLNEAIRYTRKYNPIFQKNFRILKSKAELNKIHMLRFFPDMRIKMKTGLTPEARGSADGTSYSDNADDIDGLGPFYKFEFRFSYPLYTFGRYSNARNAAKLGVNVEKAKTIYEREKYLLTLIKSYWSLSAAREASEMAREMKKNFDKLKDEVKERLLDESSDITDAHLLELKANSYNISRVHTGSLSNERYAEKVLTELSGMTVDEKSVTADETVPAYAIKEQDMSQIIAYTCNHHYQFKGMNAAARALKAKIKYTQSTQLPILYVAGAYKYGVAPNRTDIKNPFAVDNYNYNGFGAYIGFRWDLNFMKVQQDLKKLHIDYKSLSREIKVAEKKLKLNLHRAITKVRDKEKLLRECQKSLKSSRTWLRLTLDNWEMGIGQPTPAIKAYRVYYEVVKK